MSDTVTHTIAVALAGNPNVGKSTLFNAVTGLSQHTGNWPGKTVGIAMGKAVRGDTEFQFTDLPGTYSLDGKSEEERIAAQYLAQEKIDCTVVVCDGSCLQRSLLLALQILQRQARVVVCVNLMDEARRHGIEVDAAGLARHLGAPVLLTSAGRGSGIERLLIQIRQTALSPPPLQLPRWDDPIAAAEAMTDDCVICTKSRDEAFLRSVDRLLVSRRFGVPLMVLLLFFIIWLTVWGANYPGQLLQQLFDWLYGHLSRWLSITPWWLRGILLDGIYTTCSRVIAVMLPPMAIFFPLFTVLEDIGYLPRMAFLLDPCMARCGGCGKQALTLCMGLGCNAVGVMGCRIIDSPRERLAAILTNAMVPCNGRFPALILLGSLFFPHAGAALVVAACVALGVTGAAVSSGVLSKTCLRSAPSSFVMEMPPFRRPRLGKVLLHALLDRTLRIATRAMTVAAPAGALLWLFSQMGLLTMLSDAMDPVGVFLGMNGVILLAFLFSLPANELLIPVILMTLTGADSLQAVSGVSTQMLLRSSMTVQMAVCTMVFTLFHWPCATTLMTVYRETGSVKKTAAAAALPTAVGGIVCIALQLLL